MFTSNWNRRHFISVATVASTCLLCLNPCLADNDVPRFKNLAEAMREAADRIHTAVSSNRTNPDRTPTVAVGRFEYISVDVASRTPGSGPGISDALSKALAKQNVQVTYEAKYLVTGTFSPSEFEPVAGVRQVSLQVSFQLQDSFGERLEAFDLQFVDISEIGQLAGATVDLYAKPDQPRSDMLLASFRRPQAPIRDATVFAGENSNYGVEILVKDRTGDYRAATPQTSEGAAFVPLKRGDVYALRIVNNSDYDAAVKIGIDGLSVFAFSEMKYRQFIVGAKSKAIIPGWHRTNEYSREFIVGDYAKAPAARLLHDRYQASTSGIINVAFARAWSPGGPAPDNLANRARAAQRVNSELGTGDGEKVDKKYQVVRRHVDDANAFVTVRYSKPAAK